MFQLKSTPWLLAALPLITPIHAATCTLNNEAKAGESCATVSSTFGLTVTQFINLNPTLTTCALTASATYCVSDNPAAALPTTTAISSPAPVGTLITSPDGSEGICGNGYTCLGSVYGDCCSAAGYCGNTTDYCGDGCNAGFGQCGGGLQPGTPISGTTTTVTSTTTVPATCEATIKTVTLPAGTVVQTVTLAPGTVTAAATKTVTPVASTVVQTATMTSVRSVTVTATVTSISPARPSPTLAGTYAQCSKYAPWKATDKCAKFLDANGLSLADFNDLNPNFDCYNPKASYYVCVAY